MGGGVLNDTSQTGMVGFREASEQHFDTPLVSLPVPVPTHLNAKNDTCCILTNASCSATVVRAGNVNVYKAE